MSIVAQAGPRERMMPVEKARIRCPICGKADFCLIEPDGAKAICMRSSEGGKPVDMGSLGEGRLFVIDGTDQAQEQPQVPAIPRPEPADRDTLHRAYSAILVALPLLPEHRRSLRARGMSDEQIDLAGYRSLRGPGRALLAQIAREAVGGDEETALRVPGVYLKREADRAWLSFSGDAGTVIPCRDLSGRVFSLLVRRDGDADPRYRLVTSRGEHRGHGPGPVAGAHVPMLPAQRDVVRITEGPLKGDTATALSGVLTVAVPGVSAWRLAMPILQELRPDLVLVALDSDYRRNTQVARALVALVNNLQARGAA